jgi:hypothetical protein
MQGDSNSHATVILVGVMCWSDVAPVDLIDLTCMKKIGTQSLCCLNFMAKRHCCWSRWSRKVVGPMDRTDIHRQYVHVEGQRQNRVTWLKSSLTMDVASASMYGQRGTGPWRAGAGCAHGLKEKASLAMEVMAAKFTGKQEINRKWSKGARLMQTRMLQHRERWNKPHDDSGAFETLGTT